MRESEQLMRDIEQYYLPRKLVDAIHARGEIPRFNQEVQVGVGFIDIADYTFLSKFLSPSENQTLLNGLYTAFQVVLDRHGGYLNKLEGDSLMFQFDTVMDRELSALGPDESHRYIVRELFATCVEMQKVCAEFNAAKETFLAQDCSEAGRQALADAFTIIKTLRERPDLSESMSAFFQVRIRIGASLGAVTIGNFGPEGAKQWDIIGMPVIDAKRMESTSPVGGLRISAEYYRILDSLGLADEYWQRFQAEAKNAGGRYSSITKAEVFAFKKVTLSEKRDASYETYSVQVDPLFPENLVKQIDSLLDRGDPGAERSVQLIRYYRGNKYFLDQLEQLFSVREVNLHKDYLVSLLAPKKAREWADIDPSWAEKLSLRRVFEAMDRKLDILSRPAEARRPGEFFSWEQRMSSRTTDYAQRFEKRRSLVVQKARFQEVLVPLVCESLQASILEFQNRSDEAELQELDE